MKVDHLLLCLVKREDDSYLFRQGYTKFDFTDCVGVCWHIFRLGMFWIGWEETVV